MKVRIAAIVLSVVVACTAPTLASGDEHGAVHESTSIAGTGPGWFVAIWSPNPGSHHPDRYVELVSPTGRRTILYRIRSGLGQLVEWSGDGSRVLLDRQSKDGTTRMSIVDLATGTVQGSFLVPQDDGAAFTQPDGLAVYVNTGRLTRYSFSGAVETKFPASVHGLGQWSSTWLESPNGLYVVLGSDHGLAFFSNDGALVGKTQIPRTLDCEPESWWTPGEVLATCFNNSGIALLYVVSMWGTAPTQLLHVPHGGFGYTDAYRVDGKTFLQGAVPCGPPYLAELEGTTPVRISPPLRGGGDSVIATTSTSIALESTGGECLGYQSFVSWYTPATNTVRQVLGPLPLLTHANVDQVVAYPNPDTTGWIL